MPTLQHDQYNVGSLSFSFEGNYMPTLKHDQQNVGSLSFSSQLLLHAYSAT